MPDTALAESTVRSAPTVRTTDPAGPMGTLLRSVWFVVKFPISRPPVVDPVIATASVWFGSSERAAASRV